MELFENNHTICLENNGNFLDFFLSRKLFDLKIKESAVEK